MKQAYVSVIVAVRTHDAGLPARVLELDVRMSDATREHEIVLVFLGTPPLNAEGMAALADGLSAPLTVMSAAGGSSFEELCIAALARSVGDFVLEWDAPIELLDSSTIDLLLGESSEGAELIEMLPRRRPMLSSLFFRLANSLRPRSPSIRSAVARLSSRRVVSEVLVAARHASAPHRLVLFADGNLERREHVVELPRGARPPFAERIGEAVDVLLAGTRIGTRIPSLFAALFALTGVGAAVYAVVVPLIRGRAPEGWTTLLAFTGLAMTGVFIVLGLISAQIRLATRRSMVSAQNVVEVIAPQRPDHGRVDGRAV